MEFASDLAMPIPKRIPIPRMARTEDSLAPMARSVQELRDSADQGYKSIRSGGPLGTTEDATRLGAEMENAARTAGAREFNPKDANIFWAHREYL